MTQTVPIGSLQVANDRPFTLIAGPCQIESRDHAMSVAGRVAEICDRLGVPLIFKSSFDKANRTSASAARGVGL
ncbi:MAG: 3-deoxy-8-phosphooctulonate synthase, partial [Pseudomonadota bacterium]|nr:3-deoxy-8-phosphooctulonate synthase [Pseudomonadota bacterium]